VSFNVDKGNFKRAGIGRAGTDRVSTEDQIRLAGNVCCALTHIVCVDRYNVSFGNGIHLTIAAFGELLFDQSDDVSVG